jgi:iron-sulfur cluster repair protein YtfE (RIC family)
MVDVISIIDKILEEHRVLLNDAKQLEMITNDAGAMMAMAKSKDVFMPGRLDQVQSLKKFEELRNKVQEGLIAHFNREETYLLEAVLELGDQNIITGLKKLLAEHVVFKSRLEELKAQTDELINGQISRAMWETKAYDMRAHLSNMHTHLEKHAKDEQVLFNNIRKNITLN